ncbi:MAG: hypothetical protein K1X36_03825 [Pyrinomonadaceae bacterium]|nr:hypothetical protein [Pyrinomonadaceae bacterium]
MTDFRRSNYYTGHYRKPRAVMCGCDSRKILIKMALRPAGEAFGPAFGKILAAARGLIRKWAWIT